jgi:predicted NBD/HSP70 family sugar kinase
LTAFFVGLIILWDEECCLIEPNHGGDAAIVKQKKTLKGAANKPPTGQMAAIEVVHAPGGADEGEPFRSIHRGSNQSGMRAFNERLLLSLVRRHGPIAKSDVARLTGLSAQTASVIMRALEADKLILRGDPVRGRVGQPSVPLALNPDGAFFLGLKIGRRSADFVLVDFLGRVLKHQHRIYAYPMPEPVLEFARGCIDIAKRQLKGQANRIAGLGIAMPFELWNWAEEAGAPAKAMDDWRTIDLRSAFSKFCPWPIYVQNDATAACGAELVFGSRRMPPDFVYFYIGTFVGGGVVLNGSLYPGRSGNAGALGSMPVRNRSGESAQLIDVASLVVLERRLKASGKDPAPLWAQSNDWSAFDRQAQEWLAEAASGLAQAIASASSTIDFEMAMIDGGLPAHLLARLIERVETEIAKLDTLGIRLPTLVAGTLGPISRALGGASLPLMDRYLLDPNHSSPEN